MNAGVFLKKCLNRFSIDPALLVSRIIDVGDIVILQECGKVLWVPDDLTFYNIAVLFIHFHFTFCPHMTEWKKCEKDQHSRASPSVPSSWHSNTWININLYYDYANKNYIYFGELEMLSKTIHGSSSLYSMVPSADGLLVPLLVVQKFMFLLICCCSI